MNNYEEIYRGFAEWLDSLLKKNDMPADTKAFNFNLYEEEDEVYSVQIIASDRFDPADDEWACCEIWSSEEDIFFVEVSDEDDKSRETFQKFVTDMISGYIRRGAYGDILGSFPVGIGFVDGDIDVIYKIQEK